MRTIGQVKKSFDLMCERVLSRETQGEILANKQMVQEKIADSWIEIEQFRLLVLQTAWRIDKYKDYRKVRKDIAAVKAQMPKVLSRRSLPGALPARFVGRVQRDAVFKQITESFVMGLADGPTEVHKVTVARQVLREYEGTKGLFPTGHLPGRSASRRFRNTGGCWSWKWGICKGRQRSPSGMNRRA